MYRDVKYWLVTWEIVYLATLFLSYAKAGRLQYVRPVIAQ